MTAMSRSEADREARVAAMRGRSYPEPPPHAVAHLRAWRWRHHRVTLKPKGAGNGETGQETAYANVVCSCGWTASDCDKWTQRWYDASEHLREARAAWRRRVVEYPA